MPFRLVLVGEVLIKHHSRAEQLRAELDRGSEPADARLVVANVWVDGDARVKESMPLS
jgi:hypothetical protein